MNPCEKIQQQIAEQSSIELKQNSELQQHIIDCEQCSAFLLALNELDIELNDLPTLDAPDSLVADTLQAVEEADAPITSNSHFDRYRLRWASGFASLFVVISFAGLWQVGLKDRLWRNDEAIYSRYPDTPPASVDELDVNNEDVIAQQAPLEMEALRSAPSGLATSASSPSFESTVPVADIQDIERKEHQRRQSQSVVNETTDSFKADAGFDQDEEDRRVPELQRVEVTGSRLSEEDLKSIKSNGDLADAEDNNQAAPAPSRKPKPKNFDPIISLAQQWAQQDTPVDDSIDRLEQKLETSQFMKREIKDTFRDESNSPSVEPMQPQQVGDSISESGRIVLEKRMRETAAQRAGGLPESIIDSTNHPVNSPAQRFLQELNSLKEVTHQPATGYWANNYIPGDPAMRLLDAQLERWERVNLGANPRLEQAARQIWQPFDIPQHTALATYLHTDKTHVDGPTRMRLQVGIQASERESGQRPAMNLAVVLDMRGATSKHFDTEVRALLNSLTEVKQSGDRFSLTVAGQSGGLLIPAGKFRHGPLSVAINQLFGKQASKASDDLSLSQAITHAANDLMTDAAVDASLGTNLMLLVTASSMAGDLSELQQQIHQQAVDGLLLSAINLGGDAVPSQIDALVLAGQGHRRLLLSANDAHSLIEQELYAASRAVARAIRLRIELAPGVKLIKVHSSKKLDTQQIEQVKQAENSIDQRLAENLGIDADRGNDEAGIQIVIPAMDAGTSHVVLLDVVAEQAGPIADVRVRYKDLVNMGNAVSRAQLSLDNQQRTAGKLERNVIKNLLALELANYLSTASDWLAMGDSSKATEQVLAANQLISGIRQQWPDWNNDRELIVDQKMLAGYLAVLSASKINHEFQREWVVASLQLAAYRKVTEPIE